MMRIIIAVIAALYAGGASAGMTSRDCETLRGPMQLTLVSMSGLQKSITKMGSALPEVVQKTAGTPAGSTAETFEARRADLEKALKTFLEAGEDFTAELQKCAR